MEQRNVPAEIMNKPHRKKKEKVNFAYTFTLVYLLKLLDRKLKQAYDKDLHV